MPTNDVALTLSNVGFGHAELEFQRELARLKDYFVENNQELGELKGSITIKIELIGVREDPLPGQRQGDIVGYRNIVHGATTKLPARQGRAQKTRADGETLVVDQDELDAHGTRRLPFKPQIAQ